MSAVALAVGVSAAAAIGGAVANGSAAKKAAKTQTEASKQASAADKEAVDKANAFIQEQYEQDIANQNMLYARATGRLDPYSSAGTNALEQLTGLMRSPGGAIAGRAESGTKPEQAAKWAEWLKNAEMGAKDNTRYIEEAKQRQDWAEVQRLEAQDAVLQKNYQDAIRINKSITPYQAAIQAQEAAPEGGELYRGFNQEDFLNDPTSGSYYNPKDFENGTYTGGAQGIKDWLAQHPNATDSDIASTMKQYGVSAAQMAEATGLTINEVNQRLAKARDASVTAPNLMANFDEAKWFQDQGVDPKALTQNFDENSFLAQGGHTAGDLTRDFDRKKYLADAGFTEADLARKFTANDFQVDPGYQFRMQEGNKGIENSAAARGSQLSGATLKALAKYNSDLGSQEYGNAFDRFQRTQSQAGSALGSAQNFFNADRADLNNSVNSAFNRFGANRENLSNQFGNAFNRFGANRDNASNQYQNIYNRTTNDRTNKFNRLASMLGIGQTAATNQSGIDMNHSGNLSGASQNYSRLYSENTIGSGDREAGRIEERGNAKSMGQIEQGNALANTMTAVGNAGQNYAYLRNRPTYATNAEFFNTTPIFK